MLASNFFISYDILHQMKHLLTLEYITTLSFPNILKTYFDYITELFVTINNNFIIGTSLLSLVCWKNCLYLNLNNVT